MQLSIDISKVKSVYIGKANSCCCGCSGTYWYSSNHREAAGKSRGYPIGDKEISDTQVSKTVNKICNLVEGGAILDKMDGVCYSVVKGKRIYIAYLIG